MMQYILGKDSRAGKSRALLALLCALALLGLILPAVAQDSSSDSARTYCVKMGYLYRASPGINSGQGVCEFPDKTWCDAQAYYQGTCSRVLSPNIYPAYVYGTSGQPISSGEALCQSSGGSLRSVHTPYGDVTLCVFPNGRTCDIRSLVSGSCNGVDSWTVYARSWLDAP